MRLKTFRRCAVAVAAAALAGSGALVIAFPPASGAAETIFFAEVQPGFYSTPPVPTNICFVDVLVVGAGGGKASTGQVGGLGAVINARVAVQPGDVFSVLVGAAGAVNEFGGKG